ncbi:Poly(3-hydroxyalkanoate) polymerase subunit PhaC [wastewater metagenome]|uniref:Poly(3-hydroxyalkanoate) polymerase subunit PhaC n=4 Tax=root TaxID=1 RepID=A0A5B8RFX5_9ZZZZ|nr:poly(3-hydroxyalkanoate) polymerase subunit PhaC [uncultured organism]
MLPYAPSGESFRAVDRLYHAWQGRLTSAVSPAAVALAFQDWASHLGNSPGKQTELAFKALSKWSRWADFACRCHMETHAPDAIDPLPQDHRFDHAGWRMPPFRMLQQGFLLTQQWWHNATTDVSGVSPHHQDVVAFMARQWLDVFSPANFLATNPELLETTFHEGGNNLLRGARKALGDWNRLMSGMPPPPPADFVVGQDVAVTPGNVVYRNGLMELIQYTPATTEVYAEPVLITPAWIMKYYILDLSPENSLVRYLVAQGHTVFMISWVNPGEDDRDIGLADYLDRGFYRALSVVRRLIPDVPVHTVGYCLGGTLLAIALAALRGEAQRQVASMTLFAAQTDFSEAGELMLFIDPAQVAYLDDVMWDQGYLDPKQMVAAFQLLRANDLIWSRMTRSYLLGREETITDLMAWNADSTRLPFRMHSEYLHRLFLANDLAEGRYRVDDQPIALTDIHVPVFAVGTETDHVAPWRSVYKIKLLTDTAVTFVLTNGGHNAGVISEPGHPHRHFRIGTRTEGDPYLDPDEWQASLAPVDGSWWPAWAEWLARHSGATVPARPPERGRDRGTSLPDAPGTYVHMS